MPGWPDDAITASAPPVPAAPPEPRVHPPHEERAAQPAAAPPAAPEPQRRPWLRVARRALAWLAMVLLAGAVTFVYFTRVRRAPLPAGLIVANGRIEGDEILVSSKRAGRIDALLVDEGQQVARGQLLARMDDAELTARVDQSRARVDRAAALGRQAREAVARAEAAERQAARDAARFGDLARRGTVSRLQGEQAELAWTLASRDLASARTGVTQAEAELAQARASLAEAMSARGDAVLTAPIAGTVTARVRQPGEVVAAGAPLVAIVDLDRLYLKVYVPEPDIGKLRLGLPARIYTDAFPARAFPATVGFVSSQAEFTPKEVQTPDERVKLVFAVKLFVNDNRDRTLLPGMPADAVIRWRAEAPWVRPRW